MWYIPLDIAFIKLKREEEPIFFSSTCHRRNCISCLIRKNDFL